MSEFFVQKFFLDFLLELNGECIHSLTHQSLITCSVPDTQLSTGKIKKKKTHALSSEFVVW